MSPRKRGVPLSVTLATAIGVLTMITAATVLVISFRAASQNTLDLLNEKSVSIVRAIETGIESHLDPAEAQLAFIERRITAGHVDVGNLAPLATTLLAALAAAPQVAAVLYYDPDLMELTAFQDFSGAAGIEYADRSNIEILRQADVQVRAADAPFWGELVYRSDAQATFVNLRHPLNIDGEYLGFLVAAVSTPELSDLVAHVGDTFGATAFILHGDEKVLAHPNLTAPHPDLSADNPTIAIDRIGDLVLQNFATGAQVPGFEEAAAAGVQVRTVDLFGAEHVTFTRRVDRYGAEPWIVGAHIPVERVDAQFRRIEQASIAAFIALLLSLATAVFLGHRLARPIRRLAASAGQIGRLEINAVPDLPPSWIRELNDQANSFNTMVKGLRWFETYVPKRLVKRLMESGEAASDEREITVMFTDIAGYTNLSEKMTPGETEAFLNHHFALLAACVEAEGGTIDKFIGDALMAFWGAPDTQPDHATRAGRAARAIIAAIDQDNARREQAGLPPVRVRIGLHTDHVVVGNIGAPGRMNYTIVGDGVNIGQRLETLGKEIDDDGADVLVLASAATTNAADPAQLHFTRVGQYQVKGKDVPLEVFRLTPSSNA